MSIDKKILLSETAHLEGSPAVRETAEDEKSPVLVIPSTPRNGNNKPQNILAHLSKEDLLSDVRTFVTQRGLEEYLLDLEKGALLAQRPDDFDEIAELTEEDRAAIRYEKEHKWSHPLWLWLTIIICSTGKSRFPCVVFPGYSWEVIDLAGVVRAFTWNSGSKTLCGGVSAPEIVHIGHLGRFRLNDFYRCAVSLTYSIFAGACVQGWDQTVSHRTRSCRRESGLIRHHDHRAPMAPICPSRPSSALLREATLTNGWSVWSTLAPTLEVHYWAVG